MKRLLLVAGLLTVLGCRPGTTTQSSSRYATTAVPPTDTTAARTVADTTRPAEGTTPPAKADTKEPPSPFRPPEFEEPKEDPPEEAPPVPDAYKPLNEAKTVLFEKKDDGTRRVHLMGAVCLREGPLEVLVCKLRSKEHESILNVDADGRAIHAALVAAGAKPGSPVRFVPKYQPATGTPIKVSLTYREKGKVKTVPAGEWVKDRRTGKDLSTDWVFAGSRFFQDPDNAQAQPYYMANNGEFISLANFPDSMLDLPIKSSQEAAELMFEINTARIPPVRTPVLITLEPVVEKKK
ncbi:MAG TPA: YdjY domain-containing protein [Gemmataceae bacterium]|nr:YdjY domain-containing protein [Gemmataceae bacterium]